MEKAIISVLAIATFMSSAAAEPIQMTDEELELVHAGTNPSIQFTLVNKPNGSTVLTQNGLEYPITGSPISLSDGTQVQATRNSNGSITLVTSNGINIDVDPIPSVAPSVAIVGDSSNANANANAILPSSIESRIMIEVR